MGMPLSRYGMLDQMVYSLKCNEHNSYVDFRKFKMFVLVLHDPCDRLLYDTIRNDFGKMDYQTGPDMLFLTWVNPPDRWYEEHHEYYSFDSNGLLFDKESSVWNRDIELNEMRRMFGINDNMSALVVFTELMSNDYLIVATSAETISNQLKVIGEFCYENDKPFFENTTVAFHSLCDVLNAEIAKNDEAVADSLLALLSIGSCKKMFPSDHQKKEQRTEAILKKARNTVLCKRDHNQDAGDDIISLYNMRVLRGDDTSRVRMPRMQHIYSIPSDLMDDKLLETPSRTYIHTYNTLYNLFEEHGHTIPFPKGEVHDNSLDYSALIIYLAKILECEGNASVYQYCRKLNDIHMPEYYNKYCPDISHKTNLKYVIDNRSLSCPLNRFTCIGSYRALETRTLGELQTLIRWLQQGDAVQPPDELRLSDQEEWRRIVDLRNTAAHGGKPIDDLVFSTAFESFTNIVRESFHSLSEMKRICSK